MAFPHPESGKNKYRNGDKPNHRGVVWKFFKRTINITDYRNAKDKVNTAKNRTFGGTTHDWFVNLFSGETKPSSILRSEIENIRDAAFRPQALRRLSRSGVYVSPVVWLSPSN